MDFLIQTRYTSKIMNAEQLIIFYGDAHHPHTHDEVGNYASSRNEYGQFITGHHIEHDDPLVQPASCVLQIHLNEKQTIEVPLQEHIYYRITFPIDKTEEYKPQISEIQSYILVVNNAPCLDRPYYLHNSETYPMEFVSSTTFDLFEFPIVDGMQIFDEDGAMIFPLPTQDKDQSQQ